MSMLLKESCIIAQPTSSRSRTNIHEQNFANEIKSLERPLDDNDLIFYPIEEDKSPRLTSIGERKAPIRKRTIRNIKTVIEIMMFLFGRPV